MTTREIMEGASLPDTPQNRNRVVALFSIAKENMRGAVTSQQNLLSDALLDQLVGEQYETNGYEGLPRILDPTAELHGLTPDGLGSFHTTRNPWRSDPPNNQFCPLSDCSTTQSQCAKGQSVADRLKGVSRSASVSSIGSCP